MPTPAPAARPGQERLPWFAPRPGPATVVTAWSAPDGSFHGPPYMCRASAGLARRQATFAELAGTLSCPCGEQLHLRELAAAIADPDRRVAVVGLVAGWFQPAQFAGEIMRAGACTLGARTVVAALPLPVGTVLRRHFGAEPLLRVRTIDAVAVAATVATLWDPTVDGPLSRFGAAARAARRLGAGGLRSSRG